MEAQAQVFASLRLSEMTVPKIDIFPIMNWKLRLGGFGPFLGCAMIACTSPANAGCPSGFDWVGGYLCAAYNVSQDYCARYGGRYVHDLPSAPPRCEVTASVDDVPSGSSYGGEGYSSDDSDLSKALNALGVFGGMLDLLSDLEDTSEFEQLRELSASYNEQGRLFADQGLYLDALEAFEMAAAYSVRAGDAVNVEINERNASLMRDLINQDASLQEMREFGEEMQRILDEMAELEKGEAGFETYNEDLPPLPVLDHLPELPELPQQDTAGERDSFTGQFSTAGLQALDPRSCIDVDHIEEAKYQLSNSCPYPVIYVVTSREFHNPERPFSQDIGRLGEAPSDGDELYSYHRFVPEIEWACADGAPGCGFAAAIDAKSAYGGD